MTISDSRRISKWHRSLLGRPAGRLSGKSAPEADPADENRRYGQIDFEDKFAAIKLHFGEAGNDTYLHPTFVRQVVDCVKATGARPFLTDTCTLYKSTRHNAVDHLETAYRHGFTPYVVDAPVIMADGVTSKCYEEVAVNLKHFASVKIAQAFLSANAMVVLSHFKGHAMGGFGGSMKNIAIGCADGRIGKAQVHAIDDVNNLGISGLPRNV